MTTTFAATALVSAPTAATGTGSNDSLSKLADNFDNFLKLLIQQLKNQDPLAPMDTNQFTTQLVQFTQVEQSIQQNKQLGQLVGLQHTNEAATAVSYIGRTVEADGSTAELKNGSATWTYTMPTTAVSGAITVLDSKGQIVRRLALDPTTGIHSVTWDGRDDVGNTRPDGLYTMRIAATDAAGKAISAATSVSGIVTGVSSTNGTTMLSIGSAELPISSVTKVR